MESAFFGFSREVGGVELGWGPGAILDGPTINNQLRTGTDKGNPTV